MIKTTQLHFMSLGRTLYGVYEEPENPRNCLILLLHGLTNSHTDCPLIKEAVQEIHKQRFPTLRFDFIGSGQSEGEFKDKTFTILYQNTLDGLTIATEKLKYKRVGLWGRSLGAILGATICDNKYIVSSVFISFCIHTEVSFSSFFPKNKPFSLPIKGTGKIKGEPILARQFYKETGWIDALQKKHLSKGSNIFIIQGTRDRTIYDLNWAKEIFKLVNEPKKLKFIEGADHTYKGYENCVIQQGIQWFLETEK